MTINHPNSFTLNLPDWTATSLARIPEIFATAEERMNLVLQFSRQNARENTGGPFAAAVFEQNTGRIIAMGVNRVIATSCSCAHAEIMALGLAQKRLGAYDLGGPGLSGHELVVNWQPCVMCFGAVLWSGVRHLSIAGSGPELEELTGFDEGPMHPQWREELAKRGISLHENVLRKEAITLFRWFKRSGRIVYNARQG